MRSKKSPSCVYILIYTLQEASLNFKESARSRRARERPRRPLASTPPLDNAPQILSFDYIVFSKRSSAPDIPDPFLCLSTIVH